MRFGADELRGQLDLIDAKVGRLRHAQPTCEPNFADYRRFRRLLSVCRSLIRAITSPIAGVPKVIGSDDAWRNSCTKVASTH
jgi:hypothetical protein